MIFYKKLHDFKFSVNWENCMFEEIIKKIQELFDTGRGDSERLFNILNSLQSGKYI